MGWNEEEDNRTYEVVLNQEEQYSIWPADKDVAEGWVKAGKSGTKEECLAYIKEVWTDMRPLSLRRAMEDAAKEG
ncbi:MbtH family protein [Streptomyces sp. NPDC091279]|uniref:MbtH family protein n=1 Tax=unclassified Streptomyces TaxID=2593676 RepID=UPI00380A7D67